MYDAGSGATSIPRIRAMEESGIRLRRMEADYPIAARGCSPLVEDPADRECVGATRLPSIAAIRDADGSPRAGQGASAQIALRMVELRAGVISMEKQQSFASAAWSRNG
jgi:hypothetical protein